MHNNIPLIGDLAPKFTAETTNGIVNFPADYKGKWVILFSHPADFTPVCTTEFMTFQKMLEEFKKMNTEVIGLSIDSISSHLAWLKTIEDDIEFNGMKNTVITFPVIADIKMNVAKLYGMLQPNASDTKAVRAVFFIDPEGKIRTILYYPLNIGRNFQEIKRILYALQLADKNHIATPADWKIGDKVIVPAPSSMRGLSEREGNKDLECKDWFLCFKDLNK